MAGEREQKLKEGLKYIFDQFDYADYVGREVKDFEAGLTAGERRVLQEMCFSDWLVKKKIVEVMSFNEWRKQQNPADKSGVVLLNSKKL